jgi:hypothetical protein
LSLASAWNLVVWSSLLASLADGIVDAYYIRPDPMRRYLEIVARREGWPVLQEAGTALNTVLIWTVVLFYMVAFPVLGGVHLPQQGAASGRGVRPDDVVRADRPGRGPLPAGLGTREESQDLEEPRPTGG